MKTSMTALAAGLFASLAMLGGAHASSRVEVGVLTCDIAAGRGIIITSSKALDCTFKPTAGRKEHYTGTIRKIGLDIGKTKSGKLVWAVFAPTHDVPPGALAGSYGGIGAEATAGVGLGANAMTGGFKKSIALQPLSVQAQHGLNVAAGISGMKLQVAK